MGVEEAEELGGGVDDEADRAQLGEQALHERDPAEARERLRGEQQDLKGQHERRRLADERAAEQPERALAEDGDGEEEGADVADEEVGRGDHVRLQRAAERAARRRDAARRDRAIKGVYACARDEERPRDVAEVPEEEVAQQAVELTPRAGEQPRDGDQLVDLVALPAQVLVDHALDHGDPVGQAQASRGQTRRRAR